MSSFSGGGDEPSAAELVVVGLSVAVTVSLFGYVAWHGATTPTGATPEATVVGAETMDEDRIAVTVELYNPGSTGLESATVSADCTNDSITFQHVPTDARLTGTFVCAAGTAAPSATVRSWVRSQGSRTN